LFDVWRWSFAGIGVLLVIPRLWSPPAWLGRRELEVTGLGLVSLTTLWMTVRPFADGYPTDHRDKVYARVAQEVDRVAPTARSLAATEVGTLGDLTSRRIIDLTGLTSKNPEYVSGEHTDRFFAEPADVVVLHDPVWGFERAIADDVRFSVLYQPVGAVADSALAMRIFARNPASEDLDPRELVRSRHPAMSVGSELGRPSPLAQCVIDSLNGRPGKAAEHVRVKALLFVAHGWATVPSWEALPQSATVRLQSRSVAYDLETVREARPDVAIAFSRPAFDHAGFSISASILDVPPGEYRVLIGQRSPAGELVWCDPGSSLSVTAVEK
jgi:hypothetical protein